jgi:hypothetical protein
MSLGGKGLIADVSEHCVCSIFIGGWVRSVGAIKNFVVREQVQNRVAYRSGCWQVAGTGCVG